MHVTELSKDELWELKDALFWGADWVETTDEQQEEIDNAQDQDDISDELIYALYDGTDFVEEDFWCNVN